MLIMAITNPSGRIKGFLQSVSCEIEANVFFAPHCTPQVFDKVYSVLCEWAPDAPQFSAVLIRIRGREWQEVDIRSIGAQGKALTLQENCGMPLVSRQKCGKIVAEGSTP